MLRCDVKEDAEEIEKERKKFSIIATRQQQSGIQGRKGMQRKGWGRGEEGEAPFCTRSPLDAAALMLSS